MTPTIGQTWRSLRDRLAAAGIETASLDARLLVRHLLGFDDTGLIAREGEVFPPERIAEMEAVVSRRLAGEPVARIVGHKEFYGLAFSLNEATLVPRPETELLVDFGRAHLAGHTAPRILDLGTGTGCIAIALLAHLPDARAVGIDLSASAVECALANAHMNGVGQRYAALEGSWFGPLGPEDRFDLIVSNPPYIASAVIGTLGTEVRAFDPVLALDGGGDGLSPYRVLVPEAADRLAPGGALAVEIGHDQAEAVSALFAGAGFEAVSVTPDLSGQARMVTGRLRESVTGA